MGNWEVPPEVREALDLMALREAGSSSKQFSFHWTPGLEAAVRDAAADARMSVAAFCRETLAARLLDGGYEL